VLLQSLLATLRQHVTALPLPPPPAAAFALGASAVLSANQTSGSANPTAAFNPIAAFNPTAPFIASDGGSARAGAPAAPTSEAAEAPSGDMETDGGSAPSELSAAERSRVLQALLGLLAAVLTETSHASHLLSIASTLLRQLHPVRTLPVARRPALSLSVTISLLGLAYNTTIVLPPPPGAGTPMHVSLAMLASQWRALLLSLLAPSRAHTHPPLVRLAALRATTAALTAAAHANSNASSASTAAAPEAAAASSAHDDAKGEAGENVGCSFAVWLGCELGARRSGSGLGVGVGLGRLAHLLKHALRLVLEPCAPLRLAALEAIEAIFLCMRQEADGAIELHAAELGTLLRAAIAQLSAGDGECRAVAARVLACSALAALAALNPHAALADGALAESGTGAETGATERTTAPTGAVAGAGAGFGGFLVVRGGVAKDAAFEVDRGGGVATSERWRHLIVETSPLPSYGPLQLQRMLRLLSSRAPGTAPLASLFARQLVLSGAGALPSLRSLVRVDVQLGGWWGGAEAARFLVHARLRSPFGGPAQTFEGMEKMLTAALPAGGAGGPGAVSGASLERLRLLLHTFEQLERQVTNACDGSLALPPPPNAARLFFANNQRVCVDWFARLRPRLLSAALATRQPASVARHAQLRLVDLAARGASYCVRTPSTGRLDLQEGLLRNMQSCLRDVEGTLYVLMDALLELGGMQVTDGLAGFVKRKLGPLHAAALRSQQDRQKPQTLLLQRDSAATAPRIHELSTAWVPWLDGMRLRAAGRLEESLVELRALLDTPAAAMAAEPAQASYVAGQVSACYATRVSWARPVGMMGAPLSRSRRRVGGYSPCGGGGARVAARSAARSAAHGGTCLFRLSPPE
jgi:hypothetical protein